MSPTYKRHLDKLADYRNPDLAHIVEHDQASESVFGFYLMPPIWICDTIPTSRDGYVPDNLISDEIVKLGCGLTIMFNREGDFLFDYFDYPGAAPVFIPGYHLQEPVDGLKAPKETIDAVHERTKNQTFALSILNVFQLLLLSVSSSNKRPIGWPNEISWDDRRVGIDFTDNVRNGAASRWRFHTEAAYRRACVHPDRTVHRALIDKSIVLQTVSQLEQLLSGDNVKSVALFREVSSSFGMYMDNRLGNAIVGFWTVIEQVIGEKWSELISETRGSRRKKLKTIAFTSAIRIELLCSLGRIDDKLYDAIEIARKARNRWIHNMDLPDHHSIRQAISSTVTLLFIRNGIRLSLSQGPGGWSIERPIWRDRRMEGRYPLGV